MIFKSVKCVLVLLIILTLSSCVSSEKYKASLSDIDGLNRNISELREKLKTTESELERCGKDLDDVSLQKNELDKSNVALREKLSENSMRITRFADELNTKDQRIFDLQTQLDKVAQEKMETVRDKEEEISMLKGTYDGLVSELNREIKDGEITITQLKDKLTLSMVDKILFDSGSAAVKKEGKLVLDRVGEIIGKTADKEIRVEGHTDNVPIGYTLVDKFPTNWELSTARATNVVRYLQESAGVDAAVLSASGYSEFRPVDSNETEEGRARNRRIEIVLLPKGLEKTQIEPGDKPIEVEP